MQRNIFIDYLKGIGILLVIIGHVIQSYMTNWEPVYLPVRMFHMPFFIAISGYFILRSIAKCDFLQFLHNRMVRLLLPVGTWGLFRAITHGGGEILVFKQIPPMSKFLGNVFFANWFLSVLFVLSVIVALVEKFGGKYKSLLYIVSVVVLYMLPNIWYTANCKWLMPFFLLAIVLSRFDWYAVKWQMAVVAAYIFVVCWHQFFQNPALLKVGTNVNSWVFHTDVVMRTLAGGSGCLLTLYLSKLLFRLNFTHKLISYLGSISLPLYVIHVQICDVNRILHITVNNYIALLLITIVLTAFCVGFYRVCCKSAKLKLYLFGE